MNRRRTLSTRDELVAVDGLVLRLRSLGPPGTPRRPSHVVVLLHGIGMSHRSFRRLQTVVAMRYPTVAVDLPGFAGLPPAGRPLGAEGFAGLIVRVLRTRGVVRATLVGHSMGTQVAVEVALLDPELVGELVLIGPVVDDRRRAVPLLLVDLLRDDAVEGLRMNGVSATDSLRSARQYARELRPMLAHPMLERTARVRQPIAVVRGDGDPVSRPGWARRLVRASHRSHLEELPGPHHVQQHDPVGVADVLHRLVTRAGPPTRAAPPDRRPGPIRKAIWWVRDWLYAGVWQVRTLGPTTADDYRSGNGQPVVVLPGIYETWHFMRPLMDALHDDGHPVHVLPTLRRNVRTVPDSARLLVELLEQEDLRDVLLLAHSKGGLIGKYAMTHLDDDGRIDRMVAVSTPFGGSRWATLAPVGHLRVFRAADPVLAAMARVRAANDRITSVFGVFDTLIPEGSELAGATNVRVPVGGHFRILGDPRTYRAVLEASRRGSGVAHPS